MLSKFLAWGLGGGSVVGSAEGCSKGITARRGKTWTDSGEDGAGGEGGGEVARSLMTVTSTQPRAVMNAGLRLKKTWGLILDLSLARPLNSLGNVTTSFWVSASPPEK